MSSSPPVVRALTQELLAELPGTFRALVSATEPGVAAGFAMLDASAVGRPVGTWTPLVTDGAAVAVGEPLVEVVGTAGELATAEDHVLGVLGFAGGIARRCVELRSAAPEDLRIACGGWKKLPSALKPVLRSGLDAGGVTPRLVAGDFVYIDKNVVHLLGGVGAAVPRGLALGNGPVAVQVDSAEEALAAVAAGAGIVMVDTGSIDGLAAVHAALLAAGARARVVLAFAGGVVAEDLFSVRAAGADVVDLGRAIIDAPLWDLHMVVVD